MADVYSLMARSEQDGKRAPSRRANDMRTTGYKLQRIAEPMPETVLEAEED